MTTWTNGSPSGRGGHSGDSRLLLPVLLLLLGGGDALSSTFLFFRESRRAAASDMYFLLSTHTRGGERDTQRADTYKKMGGRGDIVTIMGCTILEKPSEHGSFRMQEAEYQSCKARSNGLHTFQHTHTTTDSNNCNKKLYDAKCNKCSRYKVTIQYTVSNTYTVKKESHFFRIYKFENCRKNRDPMSLITWDLVRRGERERVLYPSLMEVVSQAQGDTAKVGVSKFSPPHSPIPCTT